MRHRVPQQQPLRVERPRKPQMNDSKYFPPGPQKVIRTPIHILKREVFSSPPRSSRGKELSSRSPVQELTKLQEVQRKSSPTPVVPKVTSSTQEKPLGEVKPIIGRETSQKKEIPVAQEDKSDETVSSDVTFIERFVHFASGIMNPCPYF